MERDTSKDLHSRFGDATISAPVGGGWNRRYLDDDTEVVVYGSVDSDQTLINSSPDLETEKVVVIGEVPGTSPEPSPKNAFITITIPLPWSKKSHKRSTSDVQPQVCSREAHQLSKSQTRTPSTASKSNLPPPARNIESLISNSRSDTPFFHLPSDHSRSPRIGATERNPSISAVLSPVSEEFAKDREGFVNTTSVTPQQGQDCSRHSSTLHSISRFVHSSEVRTSRSLSSARAELGIDSTEGIRCASRASSREASRRRAISREPVGRRRALSQEPPRQRSASAAPTVQGQHFRGHRRFGSQSSNDAEDEATDIDSGAESESTRFSSGAHSFRSMTEDSSAALDHDGIKRSPFLRQGSGGYFSGVAADYRNIQREVSAATELETRRRAAKKQHTKVTVMNLPSKELVPTGEELWS